MLISDAALDAACRQTDVWEAKQKAADERSKKWQLREEKKERASRARGADGPGPKSGGTTRSVGGCRRNSTKGAAAARSGSDAREPRRQVVVACVCVSGVQGIFAINFVDRRRRLFVDAVAGPKRPADLIFDSKKSLLASFT